MAGYENCRSDQDCHCCSLIQYRMAKRMASTINHLEKDLPQTTISVLDLPPLKNNDNNKEISLYNFTLAREKTTTTISKKMRDEDTRDILRGDGIHLTPRGGEIAAREINKLVANNNNNNNNNPKQQTTKVTANIPIPIPETTAESWYIQKKQAAPSSEKAERTSEKSRKSTPYQSTYTTKRKTQMNRE